MAARARRSTSLLLVVALLAATYFSCASAFNLVRPEGLHGRKFLSPTTKKIEAGRRHNSFLKMAPGHDQVKTDNVRTGFNKGGAVLRPAATDTYYSRIVDHEAKTHNIHAGSKRQGVTNIRPAVSSAVKRISTDKPVRSESGGVLYSSSQAKSSDNVHTGFNRGGAVLQSAPKDTYYSRTVAAHLKAKSRENVAAASNGNLNGRSVTLHRPKKVVTDNQIKTREPRTYSRTVAASQAKTDNVHTKAGLPRTYSRTVAASRAKTDNVYTGSNNRGASVLH